MPHYLLEQGHFLSIFFSHLSKLRLEDFNVGFKAKQGLSSDNIILRQTKILSLKLSNFESIDVSRNSLMRKLFNLQEFLIFMILLILIRSKRIHDHHSMLILIDRTIRVQRISLKSSLVLTTRDSSNHNAESSDLLFISEVLNNLRELSLPFIQAFYLDSSESPKSI